MGNEPIVGLLIVIVCMCLLLLKRSYDHGDALDSYRRQAKKAFYAAGRAQEALDSLIIDSDLSKGDRSRLESASNRIKADIKNAFSD